MGDEEDERTEVKLSDSLGLILYFSLSRGVKEINPLSEITGAAVQFDKIGAFFTRLSGLLGAKCKKSFIFRIP